MGRPRTPTAVLHLRGSFKRNPQRLRERDGEPRPTAPIGDPPASMPEEEQRVWRDFINDGFWLTGADKFMAEIAVRLIARFRAGTAKGIEVSALITTLAKLGFNPGDRAARQLPQRKDAKPPSLFHEFQ